MNTLEAKIYVGTYAKYNNGSIEGAWLNLADYSSKEDFYDACKELHEDEQDPEFMFQDRENIPSEMVSESHIDGKLWDLLDATKDFDDDRIDALWEFIDNGSSSLDDISSLISDFEEAFCGHYNSETEYAEQLLDECYDLDKMMGNLSSYFDYDRFARDLFMTDYWMSANGNVFRNI